MPELAEPDGIEVDCLGGRLRSLSQSFAGPLAEAALERMSFDRVFLGADAVTAEDGIGEADHAQTRLNERVSYELHRAVAENFARILAGAQHVDCWLTLLKTSPTHSLNHLAIALSVTR